MKILYVSINQSGRIVQFKFQIHMTQSQQNSVERIKLAEIEICSRHN